MCVCFLYINGFSRFCILRVVEAVISRKYTYVETADTQCAGECMNYTVSKQQVKIRKIDGVMTDRTFKPF